MLIFELKVVNANLSAILEQVYCQTGLFACVSLCPASSASEEGRKKGYARRSQVMNEDYSFMNLAGN